MSEKSIREIIREKSEELRDPSHLSPVTASQQLVELSSLLASLNTYISDKQYWFNLLLAMKQEELKSASRARIAAEASKEWQELDQAKAQKNALIELIRGLKYYIRSAEVEMKESRY